MGASTPGAFASAIGRSALVGGLATLGLVPTLGVSLGDGRRLVKRLGHLVQHNREVFRALLRDASRALGLAHCPINWLRVHHLRPPELQLCPLARVLGQLALKACVLVLAVPFPERGGSVVVARGLLVAESGLSMLIRVLGHCNKYAGQVRGE